MRGKVYVDKAPSKNVVVLRNRHSKAVAEIEKYRLLVESVQDYAIFLLEPDGTVATWNKGAQKFKGYTADEIIGKHFSIFYPREDVEAKKPERELVLATQFGRIEDEDWRVRKDGTRFWANVVITALYDADGEVMAFAKVTRDLTERKAQENELRQANILLKQQQAQLEALNRAKDEFVSLASHQLRTPATGVKQYLGLLLEGFAGDMSNMQREYVQRAQESNNRQIATINDLLHVAQMDAGKVTLVKEETDLNKLLKNIINEQRAIFVRRNQRIVFRSETNLPGILVDVERLRMAIQNLLDNASKYTPERGQITVSVKTADDDISIVIKDTGVGISEENIPLLFQRFSRIPNELSTLVGGSGLGLYWAHSIVDLHGGTIEVVSKPGEGSTFTIKLSQGHDDA